MVVRGEGFKGLVERVLERHTFTPLKPRTQKVYRPDNGQLSLWDFYHNAVSSSQVGLFFELFSLGVYGGKLVDSVSPTISTTSSLGSFPRVDIVDISRKIARECKSCFYGKELILRDEQVANYNTCQFNHPDYRLFFEVYKHSVPKVRSFSGDEKELHKKLAESMGYGLRFDYLLLRELASRALEQEAEFNGRRLVTRALASTYRDLSRLTPTFLNSLFESPEQLVESLGIPLEDIVFKRLIIPKGVTISSLPKSQLATLNGHASEYIAVTPDLPVISLHYKHHTRARNNFLERDPLSHRRKKEKYLSEDEIPF